MPSRLHQKEPDTHVTRVTLGHFIPRTRMESHATGVPAVPTIPTTVPAVPAVTVVPTVAQVVAGAPAPAAMPQPAAAPRPQKNGEAPKRMAIPPPEKATMRGNGGIYTVFSWAPVDGILQIVKDETGEEVRLINVVRKGQEETNQAYVVMSEGAFSTLEKKGYADRGRDPRFIPYEIRENNLPNAFKGKMTRNDKLYIPLKLIQVDKRDGIAAVNRVLKDAGDIFGFPRDKCNIWIPIDPANGQLRNGIYITFPEGVDVATVAIIRLFLNGCPVYAQDGHRTGSLAAYWSH